MKAENWEKLENIFQAAIGLPLGERQPFLRRECAGDLNLQSEIESLIESFESDAAFLDEPVFDLGLGALHQTSQKNLSGQTIASYEILEKIGAGGMGEVYKAFDTKLSRTVALKFLSENLKTDASARRQLIREAQAAAALDHPNICAVYGFEQTVEHHFIVMQYVEGKTLEDRFADEKPGVKEFERIARQILDAVAFAHSHGVLHRDLKPGNIMLTTEGQIKILDFGLAKIDSAKEISGANSRQDLSRFSQNGLIVGTVSYMSPEQLRGERLDFRSDIFSLGIIFYKLICGKNPFNRPSQAETIAAILNSDSVSFKTNNSPADNYSDHFLKIVEKCLRADKNDRFESTAAMLIEMHQAVNETGSRNGRRKKVSVYYKTAFAIISLLAFFFIYFYLTSGRATNRTLAVLPIMFDSNQTEKEYLAGGLTQNIIDNLSKLSDLKVKNEFSTTSYQNKNIELQTAGKELKVDAVFYGVLRNRAGGLFLETRIIRTSDGTLIDLADWEINETNLVDTLQNIVGRIINKINSRLTDIDRTKFAKKDTESSQAKDFYMQGRYFLKQRKNGDDLSKAIQAFINAKDIDQNYAKAWAGLADAYLLQSTVGAKKAITPQQSVEMAKKAANRAIELDNSLSEAYTSLGMISSRYDWNWRSAEDYFRTAIHLDPEFLPARFGLIRVLSYLGRNDEEMEEAKKIKEYDPLSLSSDIQIALVYYRKGEYDQAEKILSDLLKRFDNDIRVKYAQTYLLLKTNRPKEALELIEPLYKSGKDEDRVYAAAPLGYAYAKTGRREEALKIIADLKEIRKRTYVPAQEDALIYVGLDDFDKVFENLRQSCSEKFSSLPNWITDPIADEAKSDARFAEIRKCVNL